MLIPQQEHVGDRPSSSTSAMPGFLICSTTNAKRGAPTCALSLARCCLSQFTFNSTVFTSHWISKPINCCLLTVCVNQQIRYFSPLSCQLQRDEQICASGWYLSHSWEAFTATHHLLKKGRGEVMIKLLPSYHYRPESLSLTLRFTCIFPAFNWSL